MPTWEIDGPRRLDLDGEVGQLEVWLASGKLRVIGAEGPPRIEVTKIGTRGLRVTLEDGVMLEIAETARAYAHRADLAKIPCVSAWNAERAAATARAAAAQPVAAE